MFEIKSDFSNKTRLTRYAKKHSAEATSCFKNLNRLLTALNDGMTLQQCTFGFLGSEGHDVYRIAQTKVANAHETRLYIYIAITEKDVHVLTMGDKQSQPEDIKWCHETARKIQKGTI